MRQHDIENLYRTHRDDLYDYLVMHIKDHGLAEDLLQDLFLKISKEPDKISGVRNKNAYLFIMTRNMIIDYWRKASVSRRIEKEFWDNIEREKLVFHYPCLQDDKEAIFREITALLTEQERTIFVMNGDDGYSYKEIADKMNLSKSTIKNHMISALRKIRIHLAENKGYWIFVLLVLL